MRKCLTQKKEMMQTNKRVLVFNPRKTLVAIFHSGFAAARAFNVHTQSIHYACNGKCVSCNNLYFRFTTEDVEVTDGDIGVLKLQEYDDLCGQKHKYYSNTKMTRKGMKYSTAKSRERERQKELRKQQKMQKENESKDRQQIEQ